MASGEGFTKQVSPGEGFRKQISPGEGFTKQVSPASSEGGNWRRTMSGQSMDGGERWSRQLSESSRKLTQEEADFFQEKVEIARDVMKKVMGPDDSVFDNIEDGLGPPTAEVTEAHFKRRLLANEVLAATEDHMWSALDAKVYQAPHTIDRRNSIADFRHGSMQQRAHPAVSKALEEVMAQRYGGAEPKFVRQISDEECKALAEDEVTMESVVRVRRANTVCADGWGRTLSGGFTQGDEPRPVAPASLSRRRSSSGMNRSSSGLNRGSSFLSRTRTFSHISANSAGRDESGFDKDPTLASLKEPLRRASILHDEVNTLLKTEGLEMARKTPLSHAKPVLVDPIGIRCVAHLHDPKWTALARHIRGTIYDPDFYDDGTYGPMYVRLAIHGAATWDQHDQTGGLEGAAMRFKPEYSDAHNKFCKEVIKRQHEHIKVPFPWASYADIQCLASYVALECANGPVIPFSPGRRDVKPAKDVDGGDDFVVLNYRERGDVGCEDEPVKCPASGNSGGECPFLRKIKVMPGRLPGPEEGFLGKPCEPVSPENEKKEMEEVAQKIREIFVERIGASEQHTVALIAGGHSLGRCHPQISGYAGPWQSNPGYFNNVYCKKLLSENWKLVDRNMVDHSGDMITGLKPYGMRRQYVNKGGKGDLMMLVSDMALREDPYFGYWIQEYALDNEKLKKDFGDAFKWITEVGFEKPAEKTGLAKLIFNVRKWRADALKWIGEHVCTTLTGLGSPGGSGNDDAAPTVMAADVPKIGDPYTMDEVKAHSSKDDCWVAINGKVCNLTAFMSKHPGGVAVIMDKAGKDATSEWNTIHSSDAIERICPEVVIGYLVAEKEGGASPSVPETAKGA